MSDQPYRYCPLCATPLGQKTVFGQIRSVCPACGFVHFLDPKVVVVVVVEHEGQVLLGQRNIDPARGRWSFISGYVDRGEAVEAAAVREVREETGLDVTLTGLLGVYSLDGQPHVAIAYRARPCDDVASLTPEAAEVAALAFVAPESVPELAFPGDAAIWRDWQRLRVGLTGHLG